MSWWTAIGNATKVAVDATVAGSKVAIDATTSATKTAVDHTVAYYNGTGTELFTRGALVAGIESGDVAELKAAINVRNFDNDGYTCPPPKLRPLVPPTRTGCSQGVRTSEGDAQLQP